MPLKTLVNLPIDVSGASKSVELLGSPSTGYRVLDSLGGCCEGTGLRTRREPKISFYSL